MNESKRFWVEYLDKWLGWFLPGVITGLCIGFIIGMELAKHGW